MHLLDPTIIAKATEAGELLIRAVAVIGSLSPAQQEALRHATDGAAPDALVMALKALRRISPDLANSMRTHPPQGVTLPR